LQRRLVENLIHTYIDQCKRILFLNLTPFDWSIVMSFAASARLIRTLVTPVIIVSVLFISPVNLSATVTVQYNTVAQTLADDFMGINYSAYWDELQGNVGSRDALRRGGVKLLRFPGGVAANSYNWEFYLTNDDRGSVMCLTGTNELKPYVENIGAKVYMTSNFNDTRIHQAAWVTYCKTNNINAPYWEIGNEPDLINTTNWSDQNTWLPQLTAYFDTFKVHAQALKAANSAIKILGPTSTNDFYWNSTTGPNTLQRFLNAGCGTYADAISLHWYKGGGGNIATDLAARWSLVRGCGQEWPTLMNAIKAKTQKPVYITEWNCLGPGMADASGDFAKTVALALANADVIGSFAKTGVAGHTLWATHGTENSWGVLGGATDGYFFADEPTPTYFIFPLWAAMGNQVLDLTNTSTASNTLSAWAHKKANGNVQVMLINKTNAARSETVSFNGYNPTSKQVAIYELRGETDSYDNFNVIYNGVATPKPASSELPCPTVATCSGTSFTRSLPPFSITVLCFGETGCSSSNRSTLFKTLSHGTEIYNTPGQFLIRLPASINKGQATIGLYTVSGKLVNTLKSTGSENEYSIDKSAYMSGPYIIRISLPGNTITERVMIKD
jgi:O-glycosyl hydrolase